MIFAWNKMLDTSAKQMAPFGVPFVLAKATGPPKFVGCLGLVPTL